MSKRDPAQQATPQGQPQQSQQTGTAQGQPQPPQNKQSGRRVLAMNEIEDRELRFKLKHYLNQANPVNSTVNEKVNVTDKAGDRNEVERKRQVFDGYQFYNVDGKPIDEWIAANFKGAKLDHKTKELYYDTAAETT